MTNLLLKRLFFQCLPIHDIETQANQGIVYRREFSMTFRWYPSCPPVLTLRVSFGEIHLRLSTSCT